MRTINNVKTLLVLAMTLTMANAASAQKEAPPQGSAPKPFTLPAHETYSLSNGMKVTLVPYGNIPKVTVSAVISAGNLNEPAELPGLADLMGHLMKEGTKTRSSQKVAEESADMGGSLDVSVGADESAIETDVLSEFAPKAIALVGDVARNPLFPDSEVARIKNDMLRQLTIQKSTPQNMALMRFRKLLYGNHPYGTVFATEDSIQKATLADVKKYYDTNFGAQRTHLYVAGKFNTAAVKKAITAAFGTWSKGPAPAPDVPQVKPNHTLDLTDRPKAPQSTLYVGLPVANATSEDSIPLLVTNSLLGGSFGSRITSNIREQKGYTYSPSSQISRRYHDAYWVEVADVTTKFTGPSLKEIFGEIERLQKEPPSNAELKGIQSFLSGIFVLQNSSRGALIGQLRYVNLQGLGDAYLSTYVQKVNAVTPKDVQAMTVKYIKPEEMTIVVVGDKAQIMDQLAPYMTGNSQTH